MRYYKQIDGLRAIAIFSVLVFHFLPFLNVDFRYFNGYLGVDLFFVISGFLLGSNIYSKSIKNEFSFVEFYHRRIKRILPATLYVLLISSIVAYFLFIDYDLKQFFKSLFASLGFVANIYFWLSGGYFGDDNALKPLLHFWSLGVEEQFYIFLPIFLFLLIKYIKNAIVLVGILAFVTLCSFALNVYLNIIGGQNPAFFMFPTRVWEFGFGVIVGIISANNMYVFKNTNQLKLIYYAVLIALLLSFFAPSLHWLPNAFFVCFFASLFLFINHQHSYKTPLTNSAFVYVGAISFSLYLIHWPLLVFAKYYFVNGVSAYILAIIAISTFVLSALSYKYIETYYRFKISTKSMYLHFIVLILFIFAIFALYLKSTNQTSHNLSSAYASALQSNFRCDVDSYRVFGASRVCVLNDNQTNIQEASFVLWGNSHAQMYAPLFIDRLHKSNINGILLPLNGCLPTTNVNYSKKCLQLAQTNYNALDSLKGAKTIVIGMTYYGKLIDANGNRVDKLALGRDLIKLIKHFRNKGIRVYLMSPLSIPDKNIASYVSRAVKFDFINKDKLQDVLKTKRKLYDIQYKELNDLLKNKLQDNYIQTYKAFCDEDYCYFGDEIGSYFSDSNHLSSYGVKKLSNIFLQLKIDDNQ